jgi:hypothetical protein
MSINVTNRLHATEVDPDELAYIVLSFFGRGSNGGSRKPRYFKEGTEDSYIEFEYGKRGNLLKITAQPTLIETDLDTLQESIQQKLIDNQVEKIGQSVAFSFPSIKGYFRYDNLFQINPSLELLPDTHPLQIPFLLQFRYKSCDDFAIISRRKRAALTRYTRYLNVIANEVVEPPPRYTEQLWVYADDTKSSVWKQAGYIPPVALGDLEAFTPFEDTQRIDICEPNDYYKRSGSGFEGGLSLPNIATHLLDKVHSLRATDLEKFDRSAVWFKMSHDVYSTSSSSSFNALATSIECLLPENKSRCECCGQPVYEITRRFLDFLIAYAQPSPELQTEIVKLYKKYYPMRSGLTHGSALLASDLKPWAFMSEKSQEEYMIRLALHDTVRIAIINWLYQR